MNYRSMCETVRRAKINDPEGELVGRLEQLGFNVDVNDEGLGIFADEESSMFFEDESEPDGEGFVPKVIQPYLLSGEIMLVNEVGHYEGGDSLFAAVYLITPESLVVEDLQSLGETLIKAYHTVKARKEAEQGAQ